MSELETSLSCAKRMAAGKLRIGVPASVANVVLIPAMEDFCARYPDIRIEIGIGEQTGRSRRRTVRLCPAHRSDR
jgi:DNA-binding transcriptional LysR family regulator